MHPGVGDDGPPMEGLETSEWGRLGAGIDQTPAPRPGTDAS